VAVATRSDYVDGDLRDLPVEVWLDDGGSDELLPGELIMRASFLSAAKTLS
jgi:hypothetical protein